MPQEVAREYNGGFIGLIRWGLYKRMIDALPEGVLVLSHKFTGLTDKGDHVTVDFEGHDSIDVDLVVGADGIDSAVRKQIWGDSPNRPHNIHLESPRCVRRAFCWCQPARSRGSVWA